MDHADARFPDLVGTLALRVSSTGAKSWVVFYRVDRKQRRATLDRFPGMSIKAARAEARSILKAASEGIDLVAERRRQAELQKVQAQEDQANTVEAVAARFLERHVRKHNRPTTARAVGQVLKAEVLPKWGSRPVDGIGRRDVLDLLDGIMDRGAAYQANRTLAHVRKLFNWAVERGIVEENPAAGLRAPGKEQSRDRILSDDEARAVWGACEGLGYPFGPIFRLLLLTGQRLGEVASMRRGDVDLKKKLWTLPAAATKAGRVHEVPLPDAAVEIIECLPHLVGGPYLFSTTGGDRPPSGFSRAKTRADKLVVDAAEKARAEGGQPVDVAPWRLHDLRRTVASGMARLGVAPQVLARVLNHSPGSTQGVTAIYNRHGYDAEKRHALDLWARHLADLLEPAPEKVVPLRRGA